MTDSAPLRKKNQEWLQRASAYARERLREELPAAYVFHNLDRTVERAELARTFAEGLGLSREDRLILELAAWFQDLGYVQGHARHRAASVAIWEAFAEKQPHPPVDPEAVSRLIRQSDVPEATDTLGRALHDINASWLGEKRFFGLNNLLRLEREGAGGESFSLQDWQQSMLALLVDTNYYTPFGRDSFLDRKIKNIAKQRKQLAKAQEREVRKRTGKDFGRGVDTVYRVTFRNHINLSRIADGKANMIISINTVVLSVLITLGSAGFTAFRNNIDEGWIFLVPVLLLMLTSLTALVFAVLSALPKVSEASFTEEDIAAHRISLLYFGNFLQLPEPKFVGYLRDLKRDQEILYDDLSRDLYNLGKVLKFKYRLLTYAYRTFMGGLVLSMIAFLVTALVYYFRYAYT